VNIATPQAQHSFGFWAFFHFWGWKGQCIEKSLSDRRWLRNALVNGRLTTLQAFGVMAVSLSRHLPS
jgi:hypothetical protein